MNLYPTTVIENFYANPDKIRNFALSQRFSFCHEEKNLNYVYPGCRTKEVYELDANLHTNICKKLVSVFHNSENDMMRWAISTRFQSVSKNFSEGIIHKDHNNIFAGVLFLTPDAPLDSGTSIYKPNKNFDENKYQKALSDNDKRFHMGEIVMDTEYHKMFDEVLRVNNVYNTLIVYEGDQFHAANKFFGNQLTDSRLTQVFFINNIDAQKYSVFPMKRTQNIHI